LLKLAEQHPSADESEMADVIDLAFAAVTADDDATLENAGKRLDHARYGPALKQQGHLGLARAYDKKGNSEQAVAVHLNAALAVKVPGKNPLRPEIDKEIKGFAEHLNRMADWKSSKDAAEAIARSSLCEGLLLKWRAADLGDNLETAADLYAEAVYNRAYASAMSQFRIAATPRAEIYRVHQSVTNGQQGADGFFVPLLEKKLNFADAKKDLEEVMPEGEAAAKLSEKLADQRKQKKKWWEQKACEVLVETGKAKERWTEITATDADSCVAGYIAASVCYRKAIALKEYPEKPWYPIYKLGAAYSRCNLEKPNPAYAEIAKTELSKSKDALNALPAAERTLNQKYLNEVTKILNNLEK
jgi:hypothetical protein